MKNRWVNLLFALLVILIAGLSFHLFVLAQTKEAVGLILNIIKALNVLLVTILLFVLSRYLLRLYLGYRHKATGFRLQTKLVLAILPLTLLPSLALFFLSTSFVDDFVLSAVNNPVGTEVLQATDDFTNRHIQQMREMHLKHGPILMDQMQGKNDNELVAYLDRYGLDGFEYAENGRRLKRITGTSFPADKLDQLSNVTPFRNEKEFFQFADGSLLDRFSYVDGARRLTFLYCMDTPFTERFLFLRDSYRYLNYGKKKTRKLAEINRSILFVTTLFIIFGGIWTGLTFARRYQTAFNVLIEGAREVASGNLETRIELKTGDEMEDVVTAFNGMTGRLEQNREELEQRALDLGLLNTRLSEEIQYTQTILQQSKAGIISTDEQDRAHTVNPAARKLLGLKNTGDLVPLTDLLDGVKHLNLLQQWQQFKERDEAFGQLELNQGDEVRFVASSMVPLSRDGKRFGSLIVLEDLTELLNAQKVAAWRDVAKRVAHEIKNPLTPIQLSIQRVQRKASRGAPDLSEVVASAYETIMSETDLLKNLVNEFSTFAKMPSPNKTVVDMADLVGSVCKSYRPVYPKLEIRVAIEGDQQTLWCDPGQIRQVLSNLLQNAAQASEAGKVITVGSQASLEKLKLTVTDEGKGIPMAERDKVFQPYYSKSPKGTGLGLAIVKRIVEDHGGTIQIDPERQQGSRFIISLPVTKREHQKDEEAASGVKLLS